MNNFKFIHTADIHLGSILHAVGINDENLNKKLEQSVYKSFKNVCNEAIKNKVDFIIISGDLFDINNREIKVDKFFKNQCELLNKNGINLYLIAGNHDPLNDRSNIFKLPNNVFLFEGNNVQCLDFKKEDKILCKIYGISYKSSKSKIKSFSSYYNLDKSVFNIAILHTQIDGKNNEYMPCKLMDLKNTDINYWALGHIHKYSLLNQSPFIVYSGTPQGRDKGEKGIKGCVMVEVQDTSIKKVEFLHTSTILYESIDINLEEDLDICDIDSLESFILKKILDFSKKSCLQKNSYLKGHILNLNITGKCNINNFIISKTEELMEEIKKYLNNNLIKQSNFIWVDSIDFNTKFNITDEILKKNMSKELLNIINEVKLECEPYGNLRKDFINNLGSIWDLQYDKENIDESKLQITEEEINNILNKSYNLILEKLIEREEDI